MITWSRRPGSSYIAEGVGPVTRWVDVTGRGWAVPIGHRGVRDDRGLARVAGADPDHSWMYHANNVHTHTDIHTLEKFPQLVGETTRKPSISASNQHQAPWKWRSRADKRAYPVCLWCARGRGSVGSDEWPQWVAGRPASPTPGYRSPQALWAWPMSAASVRPLSGWRGTASPGKHKNLQLWGGSKTSTLLIQIRTKISNVAHSTTKTFPNNAQLSSQLFWAKARNAKWLLFALLTKLYS